MNKKKSPIPPEEYSVSYREAERQRLNALYEQFIQAGGQPKQIAFGVTAEVLRAFKKR